MTGFFNELCSVKTQNVALKTVKNYLSLNSRHPFVFFIFKTFTNNFEEISTEKIHLSAEIVCFDKPRKIF